MTEERWHRPDTGKWQPGDNWVICDLSGFKVLMSQTRKTWDGLRVHPDLWYPRHPQLDVRAVPDRPGVVDGRPRPQDVFVGPAYRVGEIYLASPNGTVFRLIVDEDLALRVIPYPCPSCGAASEFYIGGYVLTVDDGGALLVSPSASVDTSAVFLVSGGKTYYLTVGDDGALFVTGLS